MAIGSHQSARSRTDEWLTPPEILGAFGPVRPRVQGQYFAGWRQDR